jgi:hypothetical protein
VQARHYVERERKPIIHLRLSDRAYSTLRQRAELFGYVKPESITALGLPAYLASLTDPRQQWTDTRTPDLIALSSRLLDRSLDSQRRAQSGRNPRFLFDPDAPPLRNPAPSRAPGARHAVWWDPDINLPRHPRSFTLPAFESTLQYFATLALTWGITDPRFRIFQTSLSQRAANALEAIGHQSLTPSIELHNPTPPRNPTVQRHTFKEDIAW